jgi:autotransporter-associated beta strand protein
MKASRFILATPMPTATRLRTPRAVLALSIASLLAGAASSGFAANQIYNTSTVGSWDSANNANNIWSNGSASTFFTNGDNAVFSAGSGNNALGLGSDITVGNIYSNGSTNTPGTMTIGGKAGNTLTLGSGTAGSGNIADIADTTNFTSGYAGNLTYNSADTATGTFFQLAAGSGTGSTPTIWNIASGKTFTINGKATNDIADFGGNTVNLTGAGTVTLSCAGGGTLKAQNGTFNVNAGTLNLTGGSTSFNNFTNTLAVNVGTGATLKLTPNSGGTSVTYAESITLNGGLLQNGTGGVGGNAIQSGTVTIGTGTNTISSQSGSNFALTGLAGSGNVSFISGGSTYGTVITGTSTYTGTTAISSGILQFAKAASLYNSTQGTVSGNSAVIAANLTVASGATAAFNVGGTGEFTSADIDTIKGLTSVASGSPSANGFMNGAILGLDTTNATGGFTYGSTITDHVSGTTTDTLGLNKLGTNTLTLTAPNSYTGGTTVTAGTLVAANATALGSGAVKVNGGILDLNASSFTIGAPITLTSGTIQNGTLTGNSYATTSGAISAKLAGSGPLTQSGSGTTTLSGTNTYAGPTAITGGTLQFAKAVSLYNSTGGSVSGSTAVTAANLTVSSGGTAAFNVGGSGEFTSADIDYLRGLTNVVFGTSATQGFKSGSSIGLDTTNAGGSFTYGSIITNHVVGSTIDTLGLTKLGTGTLVLTAANPYSGATTVSAGTLKLSNQYAVQNSVLTMSGGAVTFDQSVTGNAFTTGGLAGTVNIALKNNATTPAAIALTIGNNNNTASYSGVLSGAGSLIKVGTGTQTISGSNNSFTGATTVNGGGLTLDYTTNNNNKIASGAAVNLGGGTLTVTGSTSGNTTQTVSGLTVNAGGSAIAVNPGSGRTATLTLGSITRNTGGTVNFGGTGTVATTAGNDASGILGTWATTGSGTSLGYATVNGSNNIVAYSGATAATAADLSNVTTATTNYSFSAAATTAASVTLTGNTLQYKTGAANTLTLGTGTTLTLNGLMNSGTGTLTVSGGTLAAGSNNELVVTGNTQAINIGSTIGTGGASALTVSTAGTVTLNGSTANTYTGLTTVAAGTLTLNKTGTGANSIAIPGDVLVSGGTLSWGASNQIATSSNLTFSGTGAISSSKTQTVGSVTVTGNTGGFNLGSGSNFTITNALSITGNNGAAYNSYSLAANTANSTMSVGSLSLDNAYYGIGQGKTSNATLTLNGDYTGANTSTIDVATTGLAGLNRLSLSTGAHNFNVTGTTTVNAAITGSGSINKQGNGTLVLNIGAGSGTGAISDFSGGVTVTAGTLTAGSNTAFGTGPITVSGGMLFMNGKTIPNAITLSVLGQLVGDGTLGGPVDLGGSTQIPNAVTLAGGSVTNGTLNVTSFSSKGGTVSANLTSAGAFTQISGSTTLSGTNNFSGGTTINGGTLLVNGSISGTTTVQTGGTLGGTGTVGTVSVLDGIVAPGSNGVGKLTTGAFSLTSNSVLKFELGDPNVVASNDRLSVGGDLNLAGMLQVTPLANFGAGTYVIADYSGNLTSNTLQLDPTFVNAYPGSYIDTTMANQVNLVVVPEPGAFVSLIGGMGMLLGLRRRRTNR